MINVYKDELNPSENKHSLLPREFIFRKQKEFVGDNTIVVVDTKEPCYWNRPLDSDILYEKDKNGIYNYNLPFINNGDVYKTNYNVLLPENSVDYVAFIKFDGSWSEEQKDKIFNLSFNAIYDSLIKLGVSEEHLKQVNNDVLYDGKKFIGSEQLFVDNVFIENVVITTKYLPEKYLFDRLTGKYAHVRKITGICEEVPSITKEDLIDSLYKNIKKKVKNI